MEHTIHPTVIITAIHTIILINTDKMGISRGVDVEFTDVYTTSLLVIVVVA